MKRYIYKMSYQATHLMKRTLAILLVAGTFTSCVENPEEAEVTGTGNAYINLSFSTSQATTTRTSDDGLKDNETAANPSEESEIHSIRVWAFESGSGEDGKPIAYQNKANIESKDGKYTLNMKFLRKSQNKEIKSIDLYILANAETIQNQSTLNIYNSAVIARKNLKNALFSAPFGIKNNKAETTEVPNTGLPISRAIINISVEGLCADTEGGAATKSIKIPLIRSVSKLHFFFARKTDGNTQDVKVTRIILNNQIIPNSSYIFPDEESYNDALSNQNATRTYGIDTHYVESSLQLDGVDNRDITAVDDPTKFCRGNESASYYMERLSNAEIKSQDLCYLRETDKTVSGTIYYQLNNGGEEKQATFSIPTDGKAIRNRELVVYGYFQNGEMGKLTIQPLVKEWEDGGTYTYIEKASSEVIIPDGDKTDWGYKVAYGKPKFGPMITIKDIDTDGKTWILQTNNPMFGFVKCDVNGNYAENQPIYGMDEKGNETTLGYTYKIEDFLKSDNGVDKEIRFYVVPKKRLDTSIPHNVKASIFITRYPNDKFFINAAGKFPGSKDGTEIYFEQVL